MITFNKKFLLILLAMLTLHSEVAQGWNFKPIWTKSKQALNGLAFIAKKTWQEMPPLVKATCIAYAGFFVYFSASIRYDDYKRHKKHLAWKQQNDARDKQHLGIKYPLYKRQKKLSKQAANHIASLITPTVDVKNIEKYLNYCKQCFPNKNNPDVRSNDFDDFYHLYYTVILERAAQTGRLDILKLWLTYTRDPAWEIHCCGYSLLLKALKNNRIDFAKYVVVMSLYNKHYYSSKYVQEALAPYPELTKWLGSVEKYCAATQAKKGEVSAIKLFDYYKNSNPDDQKEILEIAELAGHKQLLLNALERESMRKSNHLSDLRFNYLP